jgi:hypothetical protein
VPSLAVEFLIGLFVLLPFSSLNHDRLVRLVHDVGMITLFAILITRHVFPPRD